MGSLRFRLFRFPVEIQPGFWLLALIVGLRGSQPVREALTWLGIIFLSILVHELGHAFAARGYGEEPRIALHMLGGLTTWVPTRELSRWRRIQITLAGPGAGFLLGFASAAALIAWRSQASAEPSSAAYDVLRRLAWVNVFWSVVNLVPVMPFDGGQVLATALGPERRKLSASVSLVFGLVTAVALYRLGLIIGAVLFGMGGVSSFLSVIQRPSRPRMPPEAVGEILGQARRALDAGDRAQATALATAVLESSPVVDERRKALEIIAWAALLGGDVPAARNVLRSAGAALDPYLRAAIAEADGDLGQAARELELARVSGDARLEVAAMLVRVWLAAGRVTEAAELALSIADEVPDDELGRIADEADRAGASEPARRLRARLAERTLEA